MNSSVTSSAAATGDDALSRPDQEKNYLQELRDQVKHLAVEADAAVEQVRAQMKQSKATTADPTQIDFHCLLELAIRHNASYRSALLSLLQAELERDRATKDQQPSVPKLRNTFRPKIHKMTEGILLACVAAMWLLGRQDNVDVGVWYMARDAHKLATLLQQRNCKTVRLNTRQDVVQALQEALPPNSYALEAFCHQWNAGRWMGKQQQKSRQGEANRIFLDEKVLGEEPDEDGCQHQSKNSLRIQLDIRANLFRALVLDDSIQPENGDKNRTHQEQDQTVVRKRDCYLGKALKIETESMSTSIENNKIASRLRCLIRARNEVQKGVVLETTIHEFSSCFPVNSAADPAVVNLLGCLLALHDISQALPVFQKALQLDPHRQETIINIAQCFLQLGETQRSTEVWNYLCQSSPSSDCQQNIPSPVPTPPETQYGLQGPPGTTCQLELLWWLFQSSSLNTQDFEVMLMAAGGLVEKGLPHARFAQAFAWLQTGRPRAVLEVLQESKELGRVQSAVVSVCEALYEMDAKLEMEARGSEGTATLPSLCLSAVKTFEKAQKSTPHPPATAPFQELQAILYNNQGIANIMDENTGEAIRCFQVAVSEIESQSRPVSTGLLPPFYNLTLLYWKEGRTEEAVNTWSTIRGFSLENLTKLDAQLEKSVRACCVEPEPGVSLHVSTWEPNFSCSKNVHFLDCMILQSAIEQQQHQMLRSWTREMMLSGE